VAHSSLYGFDADSGTYEADRLALSSRADARVVLVCEKMAVHEAADGWFGSECPSVAHISKAALAWVMALPSEWACRALYDHARLLKVPLVFVGDLDPQALHLFASLRAGGRDALLKGRVGRVPIKWVGLDARWLDLMCKHLGLKDVPPQWTIQLSWLDREYWHLVKRMLPDARKLLGAKGFALLESGAKLEADAFLSGMRRPFLDELQRRLLRVRATSSARRSR